MPVAVLMVVGLLALVPVATRLAAPGDGATVAVCVVVVACVAAALSTFA